MWLSSSAPSRPSLEGGTPRNVVLVIGCTVRADQLTPWGAPEDVTPFLASRAAQGVRFDDTIAQAPWTRPAVTAIVTGRHALELGMVEPGDGLNEHRLPDDVATLAGLLRGAGRRTLGLSANPNASAKYGFDNGFDRYVGDVQDWRHEAVAKVPGAVVVDQALDLVDGLGPKEPFYLQLVLTDAHLPDDTSAAEVLRFSREGLPQRVARYRARLRRVDDAVARLIVGLEARGHDGRDTLFVFIGDHGEGLGYPVGHGPVHGRYLYPSSVHVPWLMWGGGVAKSVTVSGLARQLDLLPTVARYVGAPVPPEARGADLSPALRGQPVAGADEAIVDTWFREANRAAIYTSTRFCQANFGAESPVLVSPTGLPLPRFEEGCFDRQADPEARRPFRDEQLFERLRRWRKETQSRAPALTPNPPMSEEEEEALRALGYMDP